MHIQWLKQTGAPTVIVVFGGWALGPDPFRQLTGAADVLFVDDYCALSPIPELSQYQTRYVLAYSFGVAAFGHWQAEFSGAFDKKVAVNGSLTPIDRRAGIPPAIFKATHDRLSVASFQRFVALCYGAPQPDVPIDVAARQAELAAVRARGAAPDPGFDQIFISKADKIFPLANMRRAWADHAGHLVELDAPHMPFADFANWENVFAPSVQSEVRA